MLIIKGIISDFLNLLLPRKCQHCGMSLHDFEQYLCKNCLYNLPKTNFHKQLDNPVSQVFRGRVDLEYAFAHYYFAKGSAIQGLIHKIKYQGEKELAYELGKEIGYDLIDSQIKNNIDTIVPVPLHPNKEKKRGYNQSDWIARGLADVMHINYEKELLKRQIYTTTQTKKTKEQRWQNVKDAFVVNNIEQAKNKSIVIVDDVLTTGATLEACASKLLEIEGTRVSIIALAFAAD